MQPVPTEAFPIATSVEAYQDRLPIRQHGIAEHHEPGPGSLRLNEGPREPGESTSDTDAVSVSSSSAPRGRQADAGRISHRKESSQASSPGSRIDEYEKAHGSVWKRSDGMIFQVVPNAKGTSSRVSIEDFPNEVLTHILSHLPPNTLSSMSLVSRRFHKLVTTPPAWRIAFARFFPGAESIVGGQVGISWPSAEVERSQRRAFTRLSALASWRSEYILRTRLLRSLARGRPALQVVAKSTSARHSGGGQGSAVVTYQSGLMFPVSHLHAFFGVGLNKKQPLVMHGAAEQGLASSSEPAEGKLTSWGLGDVQAFKHFADLFPGEREYGLAPATVIGMPNVLDISQAFGKIYGEACPGGRLFYTATNEQRGRFLGMSSVARHVLGIPEVTMRGCAVTSVWIAKSEAPLKMSNGMFGIMAGFSNGVLATYALGTNGVYDKGLDKGEPTAKWVLCPGIPITGIQVDDRVSRPRIDAGRIWLVVLNALGEVFYLTGTPVRADHRGKATADELDSLAWQTGRRVEWDLVEATRRVAKADPFGSLAVDGSYSPRTSSDAAGLGHEQIVAETKEVEMFMGQKPSHYQSVCDGWDMRRKIVVDFAGDDGHGAGEGIFVIDCGLEEGQVAEIKRFTRTQKKISVDFERDSWPPIQAESGGRPIFGGSPVGQSGSQSPRYEARSRTSSTDHVSARFDSQWLISKLGFGDVRNMQISAVVADESELATLCATEDPLLGMSDGSNTWSPIASPLGHGSPVSSAGDIPGQRARLMGVGTQSGVVLLWNMRGSRAPAADVVNTIAAVRVLNTKSPQISSLALTSLYLVHGGNDGLVQAWDPLGSSSEPIRTLNSRFSDRARRRIAQADASAEGVGHNYFAAGAIVLDPDPTVLRGMVSLGTHLRYWSYSSTAADAYKSKKRKQLRGRLDRGSNAAEHKVTATGRGLLKDYIANEQREMEREKVAHAKENERMSGRFGTDLLGHGASDEDILAYATMLSEESFASDEARRRSSPAPISASKTRRQEVAEADFEEAIRLSLLESDQSSSAWASSPELNIAIRYGKASRHSKGSPGVKAGSSKNNKRTWSEEELELALRLSLAEEDNFPPLQKPVLVARQSLSLFQRASARRRPRLFSSTTPQDAAWGFIGLGAMGYPMAQNLRAKMASHDQLSVFDVNEQRLQQFVREAAPAVVRLAKGPRELVEESDTIVTALPEPQHVKAVFDQILASPLPPPPSGDGRLFIDASTIDPTTSRAVAAQVKSEGRAAFVDAPMSGGVVGAVAGSLTFMIGADPEQVPTVEKVLLMMGKKVWHMGPQGTGLSGKLANNYALAINNIGAAEAMNLGIRWGISPKALAALLNSATGRSWPTEVNNPVPGVLEKAPASCDYNGGFGVSLMLKDLRLAIAAANEARAKLALAERAEEVYTAAADEHKGKDFSVVYRWLGGKE
ncbi:hypothetical protein DV736_g2265, partial [Chaetothyriales sp. CBS 134916]